jgi:hypothetical protein
MNEAAIAPIPPKPPHASVLAAQIRRLAKEGAFSWGPHVFDRRDERDIDISDAKEVLMIGEIQGPIEAGINPGEWKCKMVAKVDKTSRRMGVAVVVIRNEHLFLKTVEWEDTK